MNQSQRELRVSDSACEFSDVEHFIRVFKKSGRHYAARSYQIISSGQQPHHRGHSRLILQPILPNFRPRKLRGMLIARSTG